MRLIKLYSNSCGPCKVLENNLKQANIEHESVNITSDKGEELADKYNVRNIPTLLLLDGDNLVKKFTGILTPDKLKEFCKEKAQQYPID